jgi:uncharacterized protein (TIGR03083 family)
VEQVVARPVDAVAPLTRIERIALAAEERRRWLVLLSDLDEAEWGAPSGCEGWTVKDVAAHLAGQGEQLANPVAAAKQGRAGRRLARGRALVDGITEHQVRVRAGKWPHEVVAELERVLPAAERSRRRFPWTSSRLAMRVEVPQPDGSITKERWPLAYMAQVLTRDLWMHRIDVSQALGRRMELTARHDGRLLEDVVVDWARRHGQPFDLRLTGPAGGHWTRGDGGTYLERDAVEFARGLFGRAAPPPSPLAAVVPF